MGCIGEGAGSERHERAAAWLSLTVQRANKGRAAVPSLRVSAATAAGKNPRIACLRGLWRW